MVDKPTIAALFKLTPQEAVDYLQGRGLLSVTYSWQDVWQQEHAHQFTVSRLANLDLLQAMRDGITQSVNGDLSRRDWMKNTQALLEQAGWWGRKEVTDTGTGEIVTTTFDPARLKLIYDTNTRMAYAAGLWERIERNKKSHPYIRYITQRDERVRLTHKSWDNLTLPVDHPFWDTHFPPNGWRCRCRAMSISQAEYNKGLSPLGETLNKVAPKIEYRDWVNKRSGVVERVPVGIDPGFGYNPGKARAANLVQVEAQKLAQASPVLAAAYRSADNAGMTDTIIRAALASSEFKAFFYSDAGAPNRFAVAYLSPEDRALFNCTSEVVWLSRHSVDEHILKHPEVTIEDYQAIPDIIRDAQVWAGHSTRRYLLLWIGGKPYRAAIKVDANGAETWFLSLVTSTKQKPPKGAVRVR